MDSDEFDDGLADEDFLGVLDQGTGPPKQSNAFSALSMSGNRKPAPIVREGASAVVSLELEDLPSDAFSSPEPPSRPVVPAPAPRRSIGAAPRTGLSRSTSGSFRQTTLFGGELSSSDSRPAPTQTIRAYRADTLREEPTHHEIDKEAMQTWVYPTNLGATRDYQYSIVKNSLFNNTLVALPTGLGKTFIAATVMLNFYRWTKQAKIVFVAPTKPLVAQQIDACYNIAGIPRSETTLLTGDVPPPLRAVDWKEKRVFFMTPQTLLNDISHGYADPKSIALLVIDEAHRAVGEYAYAKVTKMIRNFSKSVRLLALTATPGSKVETVQEVIDNLGISHCEIRTEDSIDIQQYVHSRNTEQVILDPSFEMEHIFELFTKALKPLTDKLSQQNIYQGRSPMALTAYGLMQAQREWFASRGRTMSQGVQGMMRAIFGVLTSIAHSIKLLNFHGIKPFYDNLADMRSEQEGRPDKGSKYKRQVLEDKSFQEMMATIEKWLRTDGFVGHPKLTALKESVLNHVMDKGESTRVIVFSEYRDSAEDIVRSLNKHKPMIKASIFVGQADGKRGEGMKQARQIETIERFRKGDFNVLVATSIGEEGLDIGQVDLIVCYDSSASPIRMLQRMGRTGRKRAGNIVLLLMRGKEEDQFAKSKDNYEKMQKLICEGSRFDFRFDLSTRIVPREIRPEVDMRRVEIPVENTQDTSLPEPNKKRKVPKGLKKPPKKFHMPDGVETGFQKLSDMLGQSTGKGKKAPAKQKKNPELSDTVEIPSMSSVMLPDAQLKELNRTYRDLPFHNDAVEEATLPNLTAHTVLQRQLRPTVKLKHGKRTKKCVKLLQKMSNSNSNTLLRPMDENEEDGYLEIPVHDFIGTDEEPEEEPVPAPKKAAPKKPAAPRKRPNAPAAARSGITTKAPEPKRRKVLGGSVNDSAHVVEPEVIDEDDGSENEGLTRRIRKPKAPKGRKGRKQQKAGINSDELGDDCMRESDGVESDGSDLGEDLMDFIVSDGHAPSSFHEPESTLPTTPSEPVRTSKHANMYDMPSSQESEDMPGLSQLVGSSSAAKAQSRTAPAPKRAGRVRQIVDSDDE